MITASCEERDSTLTFRLHGHAGSAPAGEDLICAGVTTLAYALAETVSNHAARGALAAEPRIHLSPGEAIITAAPKPTFRKTLQGAFQMAINGINLLATHYPNHVSAVIER